MMGGQNVLSFHRKKQVVYRYHKAYGRRFFSETAEQIIISASLDNGIAHPIGITLENNARIIIILTQHGQVKRNIFFHAVIAKHSIHLLQPFNRFQGTVIINRLSRFRQRFR